MGGYSRKEIVRRQLGVATRLFIDDLDPISVHCLACSAAEHASLLAREASGETFNDHIIATFPDRKLNHIRILRNQYWTPIKHSNDVKEKRPFDLSNELAGFEDRTNDHMLYVVWHDYFAAGLPLPLEVQCFQVWYYGMYPEKLRDDEGFRLSQKLFGALTALSRTQQKQCLKRAIEEHRGNLEIFQNPKTDPRPLILR